MIHGLKPASNGPVYARSVGPGFQQCRRRFSYTRVLCCMLLQLWATTRSWQTRWVSSSAVQIIFKTRNILDVNDWWCRLDSLLITNLSGGKLHIRSWVRLICCSMLQIFGTEINRTECPIVLETDIKLSVYSWTTESFKIAKCQLLCSVLHSNWQSEHVLKSLKCKDHRWRSSGS